MEDRDTDEFILVLKGYFKLLMTMNLPIDREGDSLHMDSGKHITVFKYVYSSRYVVCYIFTRRNLNSKLWITIRCYYK